MRNYAAHSELLCHDGLRRRRILQRVRDYLVPKQLIHLLEGLAFRLWKEYNVADCSNEVEYEEEVEELEADTGKRDWGTLCEYKIQRPICEGGQRVAASSNGCWENLPLSVIVATRWEFSYLCRIDPRDYADHGEEEAEHEVHGNHGS